MSGGKQGGGSPQDEGLQPRPLGALFLFMRLVLLGPPALSQQLFADETAGQLSQMGSTKHTPQSAS